MSPLIVRGPYDGRIMTMTPFTDAKSGGRRGILVALLLLASAASAQAGPQERDIFYALVSGEVCYGSQRIRVAKLEDGNFRVQITGRVLVDFFGQKQESKTKTDYVVTAALRPVSVKIESTELSGLTKMSGTVHEGALSIRVESHGQTTTKTIAKFGDAIFIGNLADWLANIPPDTDQATVETIDESDWKIVTATAKRVRREAAGATWEVRFYGGIGVQTMSMDAEGTLQESVSRAPNFRIVKSTEADTKNLVYRSMNGREVLAFPLGTEISAPHRLEQLRVRLKWKDIPFEEFQLEDRRQRVSSRSADSGGQTVVLEITKPSPLTTRASLPVEDPALALFLAETDFIKPKNEEILATARRVAAGKTESLEVVRALSEWVHGFIEAELITNTLSGPEVLATRKGKCTEYSTLFASLARSMGVPTRIALGERMIAGQWGGHMWNEAWVGQWITVDTSANEVDESMALLKFIHSDTVMGTQSLRWKLTESLDITIEKFRLRPSALDALYKTGITGRVYTNVNHACSIEAPEGWTLQDKSATGNTTIRFKVPGDDAVSLHFVAFSVPAGTPAKPIAAGRLKGMDSRFDDYELIDNAAAEVPGADAHTIHYSGSTKNTPPVQYAVTEVVWIRGPHGFLLTMSAPESAHAKCTPGFEQILQSFKSLE